MAKPDRTPAFPCIATIAFELDCCESTVRDYVSKGWLPAPFMIGGLVRWDWNEVVPAIRDLKDKLNQDGGEERKRDDPILKKINGGKS